MEPHYYKDFAQFRSHKHVPPARLHPQAENCFKICTHRSAQISLCPLLKLSVMGLYSTKLYSVHMDSFSTYACT